MMLLWTTLVPGSALLRPLVAVLQLEGEGEAGC